LYISNKIVNIKTKEEARPKYSINSFRLEKIIINEDNIIDIKKTINKKYVSFNPIFCVHFKIGPIDIAIKKIKIKGASIVL